MEKPTVSTDPVARYASDGYAIFPSVLPSDLMDEAVGHVSWLQARHPDLRPEQLGNSLMADDPFWLRLVSDSRLLDVAGRFVGADIALFASHYIAKPPRNGQQVLWHQDGSYWPLDPMEVVTLWLSLDGADADNGCMRVVPGTQHARLLTYEELEQHPDGDNVLGSGMRPEEVDAARAVDIVLRPGDVSVHHPNVIHGSNANTSPRWRRGLTIRYIPASTRIVTEGTWTSAFMLRGAPVPGVNRYRPLPRFDGARHMPFADAGAWNEKADRLNARYAAHLDAADTA